jgi:hypothetical protein
VQVFPDYSDDRYKGYCIHCGVPEGAKPFNSDHAPSRMLLDRPFPSDLPSVEICEECNSSFSEAESYLAAILECATRGSCEPNDLGNTRVGRALAVDRKLYGKMQDARMEHPTATGETRLTWIPDDSLVKRVLIKNARTHYFYECGEPLHGEPASVRYEPLHSMGDQARQSFEEIEPGLSGWPEVGSRLLQRVATGADMQDGWDIVQDGAYRYRVLDGEETVRMVVREYLACEVSWLDSD